MTTQDAGFKYLLGRYPDEALALFCPEALAERGDPAGATLLATEVPILAADSTHRLMDLSVLFTWPDHPGLIITLLEHWSDRHRIDLPRVLRYTAELVLRHPDATVLPIILLTDDWPAHRPPPVLSQGLGGWTALHLAPRLVPLRRPEAIPAGHFANHVAILLAALVPTPPEQRAELIAGIIVRYGSLSNAVEDLRILLPWLLVLARITAEAEVVATYEHLHKDHRMLNIIDLFEANGEARGKAEGEAKGKAEGKAEMIVGLVHDGLLARATAETRLRHLHEQGQIDAALLAATLARMSA